MDNLFRPRTLKLALYGYVHYTRYTSFSTLKRVEKDWELQPPPAGKVYLSNPKRSSGNALETIASILKDAYKTLFW